MSTDSDKMRLIKQLRQATNVSLSLCREALDACQGDFAQAVEYVRKNHRPVNAAEERAGKLTAYVHQGRVGVLIEVRCATDFVANTEQFQQLCKELAMQVAGVGEEDLLNQPYVRDAKQTVKELIAAVSQQVGEPISIRRVTRWELV
jgi:elongation factor Ts